MAVVMFLHLDTRADYSASDIDFGIAIQPRMFSGVQVFVQATYSALH